MENSNTTQTEQVSKKFSEVLREWLTPAEMDEVIIRNEEPRYKEGELCATHDFCDANMAMFEAIEKVTGTEPDTQSDEFTKLFNEAWVMAKANKFSIS